MNHIQKKCYEAFGKIVDHETDIEFYEIPLSVDTIVDFAKERNFDIKEFSYENKPDFTKGLSYPEGLVWVYNPNDRAGAFKSSEYTRKWRYIHELSHALTHSYILDRFCTNKINRGSGVLGYADAVVALTWEIETMKMQYSILRMLGVDVEEVHQNKEINTLFADLVYRCMTGEFTNPDLSGFIPNGEPLGDWKETLILLYKSEGLL